MIRMLATTATGRTHQQRHLPCQDSVFTLEEAGVVAMALSDGAGSAQYSQEGSAIAAATACQILCQHFDSLYNAPSPATVKLSILQPLVEKLCQRANELHTTTQDLACTLLTVAMKGDRYLLFHIGDGVIAYQKQDKLHVASAPQNGEFANTTTFVTSPKSIIQARVMRGTQPEIQGFALMSDGSESTFYQRGTQRLNPYLADVLARNHYFSPQFAAGYLNTLVHQVCIPRTGDDCSLAVLTRGTNHSTPWAHLSPRKRAALLGITTSNPNRRRRQIAKYAKHYGILPEKNQKNSA